MHSDYWVKWIVAEQKVQEGIDQARHQALVELVGRGSRTRGSAPWWRSAMLSVARVGCGWMTGPATTTRSNDLVSQLSANEGFGAC